MFMRRRPLLRAAALGGGAYALGNRHAQRLQQDADQDARIEDLENQQQPAVAAPPSGGISAESVDRLQQLGKLHEQGVLTDEEFAAEKQKVLASA
jgi:hypothetical protein